MRFLSDSSVVAGAGASTADQARDRRWRQLYAERYERLEQLERALLERPPSPEGSQRLHLVRRAKFSTWLDLESLNEPTETATGVGIT